MALTVQNKNETPFIRQVHAGGNGYVEEEGVFAWSTTDTTGELPTGIRNITNVSFCNLGAVSADEFCSVDETQVDGVIARPSTGAITILRAGASPLTGRKVMYRIRGF